MELIIKSKGDKTLEKLSDPLLAPGNEVNDNRLNDALEVIAGYTAERTEELKKVGQYHDAMKLWDSLERQIPEGSEYDHMRLAVKQERGKIGDAEEKRWEHRKEELTIYGLRGILAPMAAVALTMQSICYPFVKGFYKIVDPKGKRYEEYADEIKVTWDALKKIVTGRGLSNVIASKEERAKNLERSLI